MSNLLSNVQSSLMRFCTDFIATQTDLKFVNFDAHADDSTAPDGDLMGYAGLSIELDESVMQIEVLFGVATQTDTNLFRLNKAMGELLELLKPTKKLRLLDADTGDEVSWMIVQNGTVLLPVGGKGSRPLQYIKVSLLSGETLKG